MARSGVILVTLVTFDIFTYAHSFLEQCFHWCLVRIMGYRHQGYQCLMNLVVETRDKMLFKNSEVRQSCFTGQPLEFMDIICDSFRSLFDPSELLICIALCIRRDEIPFEILLEGFPCVVPGLWGLSKESGMLYIKDLLAKWFCASFHE